MLSTTFTTPCILLSAFTSSIASMAIDRTNHAIISRDSPRSPVTGQANNIDTNTDNYYPGFNNTCSEWHFEQDPVKSELILVARCKNGETEVCSSIDMEHCYYEADRWIFPLGDSPLNTYESAEIVLGFQDWFPDPCHDVSMFRIGFTMLPQHFKWKCDTLPPGNSPAFPPGYEDGIWQDLAMTIGTEKGILACPYAQSKGVISTNCR